MDFRLLGPLEAVGADGSAPLGGPKQRALLAVLLLNANEVVSTDRLIDDVWGEDAPPTAAASVQNSISKLRKALGSGVVETRSPGYVIQVEDESIDVRRFERHLREAQRLPAAERAAGLRQALALWRGPALSEFAFEPFAQAEIVRLEELRLVAIEDRIEAELELGFHDELVGELEALAVRHPSRERLRELQLLALYRAGRQTEALRVYQDARVALIEELGIEPGERLRALERMILAHDPALDLPAAAVARRAVPERWTRRTVAVLLAQIEQDERLDPEASRELIATRLAGAAEIVERHGGKLQQLLGDEIVAVFGAMRAHEDDALRALRAATEIREALGRDGFGVRIGVEAGQMLVGDGAVGLTGGAVTAARRLEAKAGRDEILLGPTALRLAAGAVEIVSPASGVYRLLGVVAGAPTVARRLGAPLVGRSDDLARLKAALDDAADGSRCVRVVVVGEPGKGKTRLAAELLATVGDDALALNGRCAPYGEGATYLPLRDALGEMGRDAESLLAGEDDAALVAERLLGVLAPEQSSHPSSDVAWAVRRLLEALARDNPVVLVLDDVHWAEPTLLDLVDYIAEWSSGAPILLVCLGRPELLEDRPEWADGAVMLQALEENDARALVDALPERGHVGDEAVAAVLTTAEGNPLFLEQLTVFAAEGDLRDGAVPPTVETLLASRIDRLDRPQRAVLEWAAIVGREFTRDAVEELAPDEERETIAPLLLELVRRRLVRPERSAVPGEDAFSFQHVLVRDVAYGSIPKATRAELHERLARWLDFRPDALDEIVGFHLEQAHWYRVELDDDDIALAEEAGTRLGEAGRRAFRRLDHRAAATLLFRARSLVPDSDVVHLDLAIALKDAGTLDEAAALLSDSVDRARAAGDLNLELRARVELAWPRLADGSARVSEVLDLVDRAVPVFEQAGDDFGVARALHVRAVGEVGFRLQCARAVEAATEANVRYATTGAALLCDGLLAQALMLGPTPVATSIEIYEQLQADARTARPLLAHIDDYRAVLDAMRGDADTARRQLARAAGQHEEYGHHAALPTTWARSAGWVEMLAGDVDAAESVLRAACKQLRGAGDSAWLATQTASLAGVVLAQGRVDEAVALAREAETTALTDDLLPHVLWRQVYADCLARSGALDEAERPARHALRLAEQTDVPTLRADARLTLASILAARNQVDVAAGHADDALALYETKGDVVDAARARAFRAQLLDPSASS